MDDDANERKVGLTDLGAVKAVFIQHITAEIAARDAELERIDQRLLACKVQLHQLRLAILAQEHGIEHSDLVSCRRPWYSGERKSADSKCETWKELEQQFLSAGSTAGAEDDPSNVFSSFLPESTTTKDNLTQISSACSSECSDPQPVFDVDALNWNDVPMDDLFRQENTVDSKTITDGRQFEEGMQSMANLNECSRDRTLDSVGDHNTESYKAPTLAKDSSLPDDSKRISRFHSKYRVIVGNTSQYLSRSMHSSEDPSTHKWMVYVRSDPKDPKLSSIVRAVRFFLHPSYRPHDIIQVSNPPFHLTRFGWGEFPVRVQLLFISAQHKPVDIIHQLKLDQTHTGEQMLGAETVVDIALDKKELLCKSEDRSEGYSLFPAVESHGLAEQDRQSSCRIETIPSATADIKTSSAVTTSNASTFNSFQTTTLQESPLTVHHLTLPVTHPNDVILLDHDYCCSLVVHRGPSPLPRSLRGLVTIVPLATNPKISIRSGRTLTFDDMLHDAAQKLPLHGIVNTEQCPFAARSLEQWRSWGIAKQRANEWMRAVAIRKLVQLQVGQSKESRALRTKHVVQWCRQHGHTPLDSAMKNLTCFFCKFCGHQLISIVSEDSELPDSHPVCEALFNRTYGFPSQCSSLTTPFKLVDELHQLQKVADKIQDLCEQEENINIEMLPSPKISRLSPCSAGESASPVFREPKTKELKWVHRTAAQIGITIHPLAKDGLILHVVDHMIFSACSQFLKQLLRATVAIDAAVPTKGDKEVGLYHERVIVPLQVYKAVLKLDICDFLTGAGLGLSDVYKP